MLSYTNHMDRLDRAVKEKSLVPFFRGEKYYEIVSRHADIPTDWDYAIRVTVYNYYIYHGRNTYIPMLCYASILELLQGSPVDIWCAYNVFYIFAMNEMRGTAPFNIIDLNLKEKLKKALLDNKESLEQTKQYTGRTLNKGLWDDIVIITRLLKGHNITGFEEILVA